MNIYEREAADYLLNCLSEELAEQAQEVCKMRRFGVDGMCPVAGVTNSDKFSGEAADAEAIKLLLKAVGVPLPVHIFDSERTRTKILRTVEFAVFSVERKVLSPKAFRLIEKGAESAIRFSY